MRAIIGISCYYHDSAACLLIDGKIVAAAMEERFSRIKHDNNFPANAIKYCLDWANIKASDLETVVFYEKPVVKFERILFQFLETFPFSRKIFVETMGQWMSFKLNLPKTLKKEIGFAGPVKFIDHHLSHAASVYNLSGFKDAIIITIDGVGEWATTTIGIAHGNKINLEREIRFPHSLGLFYSAITSYLGFAVNDAEYKVMGLAAYGDPKPFKSQMDELVKLHSDGSYCLNLKYFTFTGSDRMFNSKLENLFGFASRKPESKMERQYENIAAALQVKLEEALINLINQGVSTYHRKNLCIAGGVGLNSVANGKILSKTKVKSLFITPDPGDGGGAMGAVLYYWCQHLGLKLENRKFYPSLGPAYSDSQIEDVLRINNLPYEKLAGDEMIIRKVADLLAKQKIIGWFQGRMEWGPRALGNRSILASAATNEMKDIINAKVKHREMFRPFAPVILKEYVNSYFIADKNIPESAKFMLMVYPFKQKGIKDVPATVHVDNTGRLQVIDRADNPLYYDLVNKFRGLTKTPVIINTSFNVRGEPIVCTPQDAVHCFQVTDIDYLMIGPYLVRKNKKS
jgi:carbamoyltransferase